MSVSHISNIYQTNKSIKFSIPVFVIMCASRQRQRARGQCPWARNWGSPAYRRCGQHGRSRGVSGKKMTGSWPSDRLILFRRLGLPRLRMAQDRRILRDGCNQIWVPFSHGRSLPFIGNWSAESVSSPFSNPDCSWLVVGLQRDRWSESILAVVHRSDGCGGTSAQDEDRSNKGRTLPILRPRSNDTLSPW